ncbi:MAG: hypothetical protein ABIP14_05890 [Blastocatellia bacterium]
MSEIDPGIDYDLAQFFAWSRARAYAELDRRMKAEPSLDPNWTFSDIMQLLLEEYRRLQEASLHQTLSDE